MPHKVDGDEVQRLADFGQESRKVGSFLRVNSRLDGFRRVVGLRRRGIKKDFVRGTF